VYCTLARGVPTSIILHSWWCLQAKTTMRNTPQAHNLSCQRAARQWLLFLQNQGPGNVSAHLSCRLPKATPQPISYPNRAQPNEANLWYSSVTLPTNVKPRQSPKLHTSHTLQIPICATLLASTASNKHFPCPQHCLPELSSWSMR
jgi:hypothetical protein